MVVIERQDSNNSKVVDMQGYVRVNNQDLIIKEIDNKRVVTFDEIDQIHERPSGTARRNFSTNKRHFIENVDYFIFKGESGRKALIELGYTNFVKLNDNNNFKLYLISESGYLMTVKSLTDDLAWSVQRELVKNYFRIKEISNKVENNLPVVTQDVMYLQLMEVMFKELKNQKQESLNHDQRLSEVEEFIKGIKQLAQ
jgi:hypothetical protein